MRTTDDLHLAWDVPYEPGTLKAVGTRAGKVVVEEEVSTAGDPAAIGLSVDRATIRADRRDVSHITVKVLDEQGRMHPNADNEITFEIQGEGRLIGVDNGDMADMDGFQGQAPQGLAWNVPGDCAIDRQRRADPSVGRVAGPETGRRNDHDYGVIGGSSRLAGEDFR